MTNIMQEILQEKIIILDFGSQYTQLIARKIREQNVYCEILACNVPFEKIKTDNPKGIILSGGPSSVYEENAPFCSEEIFELNVPILGICYGMQLMAHLLKGKVASSSKREYGRAVLEHSTSSLLFSEIKQKIEVWMSHGDRIESLPEGFSFTAKTNNSPYAVMEDNKRHFYGLQFHPEVVHTEQGVDILKNFIFKICKCSATWNMGSFIEYSIQDIKRRVKGGKVLSALSGGVDSSVVSILIHKAIGDQLTCIFVDNGLLRKGETEKVVSTFKDNFHINMIHVDGSKQFLELLKGVEDPEEKRKIIGNEFINIFEKESKKIGGVDFLAQGTLYPDVIESVSFKGPSAVIKSHHNVGGLPERMHLKLLEPVRELFKDEVRLLGKELAIPKYLLNRQPFPGPGLAIRILGEISFPRLQLLREADAIILEEIKEAGLYEKIWQSFAVLLPVKTVGVMGDRRTYENVIGIRAVNSIDGMTADWVHLPYDLLGKISNRIINEVKGVNRVVYDISSKPPSTIEWE
jgi:GMP synthase (glutamine-hydrolysing)